MLFNPDRGTNKHVLSSFKKVPVFFSFSALCRQREKKRTVLNIIIIIIMRINERKMNEQTAYLSSRSLSPMIVTACVKNMFIPEQK
jgi:hypothetical protein